MVVVYVDGSSQKNQSGVGVYFPNGEFENQSLIYEKGTNNQMELLAFGVVFESVPDNVPLKIYSDSEYAIGCITEWYYKWVKSGTTGNYKNTDLIKQIIEAKESRTANVDIFWVKGHDKDQNNEIVDKLAKGILDPVTLTPVKVSAEKKWRTAKNFSKTNSVGKWLLFSDDSDELDTWWEIAKTNLNALCSENSILVFTQKDEIWTIEKKIRELIKYPKKMYYKYNDKSIEESYESPYIDPMKIEKNEKKREKLIDKVNKIVNKKRPGPRPDPEPDPL